MIITQEFILKLIGSLSLFIATVTGSWLVYRIVKHAHERRFSLKWWVNDLASVNFRMVVALGLFAITILVLLIGTVVDAGGLFRADFDEDIVRLILIAEFGAMGWDVLAFLGKRFTYKGTTPKTVKKKRTVRRSGAAVLPPNPV